MKKILGNKKVLIGVIVPLIVLGLVYKMFLAPKPAPVVKKVSGQIVALGDPFTLNLAGGRYGRLSVALELDEPAPAASAEAAGTAVEIPQSDLIRSIVTDHLTGITADDLINRGERHVLLADLLKDLKKSTDEPVTKVLITDLAVQ